MLVESLSVCFRNTIYMERKDKNETVSLWPFVWILLVAGLASVGSLVIALFITN